ncbi:hypothetical protein ADK91_02990 [Streptomyces sp. XY511]|nr:hypothetical protein ADK91_02990 [Streptomyces sp. XY511]
MQPAEVAEAMVGSRQWPQLADELKQLEAAGVNVAEFLGDAAPVIARMDADLRAGSTTPGVAVPVAVTEPRNPWAAPPGQDARKSDASGASIGERITEGGKDLWNKFRGKQEPALGDRAGELARLGIGPQENTRLVIMARESLSDEHQLGRLVTSREWPSVAKQMKDLQAAGHDAREALAGIPVRIQQAAAAGINLAPVEAARGLLGDLAKTSPARTAAAPATAPATAAATPGPAVTAAAPTTTAATATDRTRYDWAVSYQDESTSAKVIRSGTVWVPRDQAESEVRAVGVKELTGATRNLSSGDARISRYEFSARELPMSDQGNRFTLGGAEARRAHAGEVTASQDARAAAASAQSTTAAPGAKPTRGPAAAPTAPPKQTTPSRSHGR